MAQRARNAPGAGPFTLSINDETGPLIDGFDTPPCLMMGHVPRYYAARVEEQGYGKARDLIAYTSMPRRRRRRAPAHAPAPEQGRRD